MTRWLAGLLGLLLFTACQAEGQPIALDLAPGDIRVVASVGPLGAVEDVALETSATRPQAVAIGSGRSVYTWVYSARDLVQADGSPIPEAWLSQLSARVGPVDGGCGRCLSPSSRPPQIMHAGDRCPPPPFARVYAGAEPVPVPSEEVDALRRSIRIAWPGECACPITSPAAAPTAELDFQLIDPPPGDDGFPPEAVALAPGGNAAVFAETLAVRVDARLGRKTVLPPALPFEGPVLQATGLVGGGFLVSSVSARESFVARMDYFDDSFVPHPLIVDGDLPALPATALRASSQTATISAGDERILLSGITNGGLPGIFECALDRARARLACQRVSPTQAEALLEIRASPERGYSDVIRMPDGVLVAITPEGSVVRGVARMPATWKAADLAGAEVAGMAGRRLQSLDRIGRLGQRVFLCGRGTDYLNFVLSTTIALGRDVAPDPRSGWTSVRSGSGAACGGFSEVGGQLRATFDGGLALTLDRQGREVGRDEYVSRTLGLGQSLSALATPVPGWLLARTFDGTIWRRGAAPSFDRVYGAVRPTIQWHNAIAARGSEFLAFGFAPDATRITADERGAHVETLPLVGIGISELVMAAAADRADGSILLAGTGPAEPGWLRRLGASGVLEAVGSFPSVPVDLVEVTAGRFLLVTQDRKLYRVQGAMIEAVEILWEDPFTSSVIRAPDFDSVCSHRSVVNPGASAPPGLWVATAAGGVAWVAGCKGSLLRVNLYAEPPRAERVALEALSPFSLTAARAVCADQLILGVGGASKEAADFWELYSEPKDAAARRDDLVVIERSRGFGVPNPTGRPMGSPVAILGDSSGLVVVNSNNQAPAGTVRALPGGRAFRFSYPLISAAQNDLGQVLVGSLNSRLILGTPRR